MLDGDPDVTLELRCSEATVPRSPCSSSLTAERGTSVEKISEFARLDVEVTAAKMVASNLLLKRSIALIKSLVWLESVREVEVWACWRTLARRSGVSSVELGAEVVGVAGETERRPEFPDCANANVRKISQAGRREN